MTVSQHTPRHAPTTVTCGPASPPRGSHRPGSARWEKSPPLRSGLRASATRPRMPFPGHSPIENGHGSARRRSPRRILGTASAPQARTNAARPASCADISQRRGQGCGDAGVDQAGDACIHDAASARVALAPLAPWTAMKEGLPGATLSVSPESELEEARFHVARWIGSQSQAPGCLPDRRRWRRDRAARRAAGRRRLAAAG